MSTQKLPETLAWTGEHASELAICAIADAQVSMIPDAVLAHCEMCAECNGAIATAALLSMATGEALAEVPRASLAPASMDVRPIPWRALAIAAVVAIVCGVPSLVEATREAPTAAAAFFQGASIVVKGVGHLLRADAVPMWATLGPALLLMAVAFALTRALPRLANGLDSQGMKS